MYIYLYNPNHFNTNLEKKDEWTRCALNIFNGQNIQGKIHVAASHKRKSPMRRIIRVEETSNSPLQAIEKHRKRVIIEGRVGTKIQLNKALQTVNSNITRRYLLMWTYIL